MNRIAAAIERTKTMIASKGVPAEKLADLNKKLDMNLGEYVALQERKSLACASGKLNLDEAQLIYSLLGNTVETFNTQPLEVKIVLTQVLQELLAA